MKRAQRFGASPSPSPSPSASPSPISWKFYGGSGDPQAKVVGKSAALEKEVSCSVFCFLRELIVVSVHSISGLAQA